MRLYTSQIWVYISNSEKSLQGETATCIHTEEVCRVFFFK